MLTRRQRNIALGLLILLGFGLRIYQLDRQPLRGDEAFTVQYWMMVPLSETIEQQLTVDPQPLLAYAAFNGWASLIGTGEFTARLLPALIATLAIPAMFGFARRATRSSTVALLATTMWTIQPFIIWHSQDVRNYAVWSGVSLIALWLALCALDRNHVRDWVFYAIAATLAAYLYYLELFMIAGLALYVIVIYWRRWGVLRKWFLANISVGLVLAPWYLQPRLLSGGGYGGTTTGFDLNKLIIDFPNILFFSFTLPSSLGNITYIGVLLSLVVALIISLRNKPATGWLLLTLGIVPILILSAVTLRLNVLAPRYVLAALPALTLAISWLVIWLWQRHRLLRGIATALLATWITISAQSLSNYYTDYTKTPDWPSLTTYLTENVEPDHLVIQAAADASFGYYYHQVSDVQADERALPATPEQPVDEIRSELASASQHYEAIWIVAQGFTDWPNYGVTEAWLDENMQRTIDTRAGDLRIQQYRPWEVREIDDDSTPVTTFDNTVDVIAVQQTPTQPTGETVIWVYWRPLRQTERPLTAFVHLAGAINPAANTPLWRQDDHPPQDGRTPTTGWQTGTVYRDVFTLPDVNTLPPGTYTLSLGLYDPITGDRLQTNTNQDSVLIGEITIPAQQKSAPN